MLVQCLSLKGSLILLLDFRYCDYQASLLVALRLPPTPMVLLCLPGRPFYQLCKSLWDISCPSSLPLVALLFLLLDFLSGSIAVYDLSGPAVPQRAKKGTNIQFWILLVTVPLQLDTYLS